MHVGDTLVPRPKHHQKREPERGGLDKHGKSPQTEARCKPPDQTEIVKVMTIAKTKCADGL